MGRYHARKVAALRDAGEAVTLAGVADIDAGRAERVAAETRSRPATCGDALLGDADAAIVAVPTADHYDVSLRALAAGCDVLVEKPITVSPRQAESLLAIARRAGRVLRVGSQEWHNPALQALRPKLAPPRLVEAHRVGPFSPRGADVDVVRDLMIHDLDILQKLLGEEPERVEAIGVAVVTPRVDVANARLLFPGGCVANLTASRVAVKASRRMRFFHAGGYGSVDFLEPRASLVGCVEPASGGELRMQEEALPVGGEDALLHQLRDFVHAVLVRDISRASGDAAVAALRTALRVVDAMPAVSDFT